MRPLCSVKYPKCELPAIIIFDVFREDECDPMGLRGSLDGRPEPYCIDHAPDIDRRGDVRYLVPHHLLGQSQWMGGRRTCLDPDHGKPFLKCGTCGKVHILTSPTRR